MTSKETTKALRDEIWPLMPIDRCYGEPDTWCENCKAALDEIMLVVERHVQAARIDELNNARPPKSDDGSWLDWRHDRIAALQAKPTESKGDTA